MKKILCITLSICFSSGMVSGQRWSEEEISEADIFIQASQKKLLGKYEEAVTLYKNLLKKQPTNATAHHDIARVYLAQEELEKAEGHAAKAVRFDPEQVWFKLTLAEIQEANLNYNAAAKTFQSVAIAQNNVDLFQRWADVLIKNKKAPEAIAVYDQMDQRFGKSEFRSDDKVDLYLAKGNQKAAIQELQNWVKEHPHAVYYKMKLAKFYTFLGDQKKGKKTFEEILREHPDNTEALLALEALAPTKQGAQRVSDLVNNDELTIDQKVQAVMPIIMAGTMEELEPLLPTLKELADSNSSHAPAQAAYADAMFLVGDTEVAASYYKRTIEASPSNYQVWDQLMNITDQEGQSDDLFDLAEKALDYFPNQSGPYYFLAKAAYSNGDQSAAGNNIEEALFINGNSDRAQILKALLLEKKGGVSDAIEWLASLSNRPANTSEFLGDLYLKSGDKTKAQVAYEEAIEKGGVIQRLEQKIQSI